MACDSRAADPGQRGNQQLPLQGSLSQPPGFTLTVPQQVSVQEGLCVVVPCTFTYPASYDTDNPSAQLYGNWYKEPATVGQDPPVASSVSSLRVSQETQGRFRLTGDPAHGDCSLQISDARRTDAGRYFFSFEKGLLEHTYRSNSDGADPAFTISVPGLTEEPEIQISPARGLPGTLLAGEPVTVTCTAPGRCSGPPPRVTWTGPFSDTARDVSAQLANGTWAHSSALSFTPGPGDHGKELVCSVTYRPPQGPSTRRIVRLHVGWSLSQPPGFTLKVPQSVSVQEGLSVLVPCTFTYPAWYDTYSPSAQLYRYWYKDPADVGYDLPAASSDSSQGVSQETQGRFRLSKNPAHGDCSLQISDARQTDVGRYFLRVEKGILKYSYRSSTDGTDLMLMISVPRKSSRSHHLSAPLISSRGRHGRQRVLTLERTLQITVSRANRSDSQLFQDPGTLVANGSQLSAREGDSLRLLCSVASSPPTALSWVRGGRAIEGSRSAGKNQLRLELPNVTAEDGGLYGCWARNKESSAQGMFLLLIEYSPRLGTGLNSSCQRQGPSVICSCSLRSHPPPRVQWQVDGEPLAGNGSRGTLQVSSWARGDEAISTLSWTGSGEGGPRIFCLGSNPHGSYAALHFDFSPSQRGAEEPGRCGGVLGVGVACGLGVAIGFFLLGLCVIKLRGREPAPPSAEARELDNRSQAEHMADDASLIYSNIPTIPMHHKTPAACRTKGIQDGPAATKAPLGPREPEELHYASINVSKPQRTAGEPPEAPTTEYSEVWRKFTNPGEPGLQGLRAGCCAPLCRSRGLYQPDAPAMGRVPMPQQDAGERELPPQGPHWRAGGPATLRVLILALLWRGSLAQQPRFTLTVPQSVSVQEGLCVLVPCTFTYPASYDTKNSPARLHRYWYKDQAQNLPVASSDPSWGVSQETQGRFQLVENPARGDCSLQISDIRRTDAGRYFLRVEGVFSINYRSSTTISVTGLTEEPEIQISPARGLPEMLVAGEPVTVTCTAPGRCSGPPPRVTWTGPFSDTARDVSAQLSNGTWARSSTLSFTPGLGDHGKELVCNVTYRPPRGPSTRRTIRLHVVYPPGPPNITGTLTRNGRPVPDAWGAEGDVVSLETQGGDSLSLSCEAGSRAKATLSWAKGNNSLSPSQGDAGRLELPNLNPGDAGEYRCWAKNPFGSASRALRVHMQNPSTLVVNGSQLSAWEGDSLRFLCSVASSPPAALGWNQLRLELPNVTAEDGGLYGCWARNKESSAQGMFQLLVEYPPGPPSITGTLTRNGRPVPDAWRAESDVVSLETQEGDSLSLSCEAGSRAEATLNWAKGNESLSPNQGGAGHLELPNLSPGDAGEYRCWAKNPFGSASRALSVHVQYPGTLVANGSQLSAREGDSLRFLCSVASSPPAALGWVRGGRALEGSRPMGENQLRLELPNVKAEAGGLYGCWAQNNESSAQGMFQLLVESPRPGTKLNSSWQHQGPNLSCSCSLCSHTLPKLQWQVDGEPLAGNSLCGALQVNSGSQGDEAVSMLSGMGSGEGDHQNFCLGSNPHGFRILLLSPPGTTPRDGLTRAFIEISCKLVFAATGYFLAYYLTLLYYRRSHPLPARQVSSSTRFFPLELGFTSHPNQASAIPVCCSEPPRSRDERISALGEQPLGSVAVWLFPSCPTLDAAASQLKAPSREPGLQGRRARRRTRFCRSRGLSQPDAPAMGRAPLPLRDTGEWELSAQGPPWRRGGPAPPAATLRVLILTLLWRGSLSQLPGFTLMVPQSVSVQEGLCVLVPCTFTYPVSFDTENPQTQLYGEWYKGQAIVGQHLLVASSDPSQRVSQETQDRFWLAGDLLSGDCSLQISDAQRTDAGRYSLRIEKGKLKYSYLSNNDHTHPTLTISVPGLTEEPEIQISPARGLPGTLLAGEPVTVTCTAPGRCSGPPPRVTWMGPFSDTARDVSAQLANGTWAHSSVLSFTPGPGDHSKELVCSVTYKPPRGPSTNRTIQLHVIYSSWLNASCQRQGPIISCSCSLRSHPPPQLQWQVDGMPLTGNSSQGALQVSSWAKGDEAVSTLSWTRNGDRSPQIFCLGSSTGRMFAVLLSPPETGGLTRAFIEISCKLIFVASGFFLAYYLTLLYYRRTPCHSSATEEPTRNCNLRGLRK
ncbi:hemicentin-2-like [Mauremys reevesii]|uniref:hemicentin-2-like n=1 Tax=Mauremys reevesii TaxID=260615 RepID=UPI00193FFA7F|nr:hemicentin-2-like [Mauremys reevesii]